VIFSIIGITAKKLPREISGFGLLHDCVGFRRSPIRLRHRTLSHASCCGLDSHRTELTAFAAEFSFPITVFGEDAPALNGWDRISGIFDVYSDGDDPAYGSRHQVSEGPRAGANCHSQLRQILPK
jgi:hypothetical protein